MMMMMAVGGFFISLHHFRPVHGAAYNSIDNNGDGDVDTDAAFHLFILSGRKIRLRKFMLMKLTMKKTTK